MLAQLAAQGGREVFICGISKFGRAASLERRYQADDDGPVTVTPVTRTAESSDRIVLSCHFALTRQVATKADR
jgi:hypothetical protein